MALPASKYVDRQSPRFLVRDKDVPGFGWICEHRASVDDPASQQVYPLDYVKISNMPQWLQETLNDTNPKG